MAEERLDIIVSAAERGVSSVLNGVKDSIAKVGDEAKKLGGGMDAVAKKAADMKPQFEKMRNYGALAFAGVIGEVTLATKAFAESQKQLTLVDTALETISEDTIMAFAGSMDEAKKKVREFGAEMQAKGGIGDEDAATGLVKLTQITGDFAKATNAARIAADFAKYSQTDYSSAVDIVGKVISGNVGILGRYGIQLKEGATAEEALAEMAKRSAGQYEAYGKTLAGQSEILSQTIGDLQEEIGEALVPALVKLLEKLRPVIDGFVKFADENPETLATIIMVTGGVAALVTALGTLGLAIPGIIAGIHGIGVAMAFLAANPIVLLVAAFTALGFLLHKIFVTDWAQTKDSFLFLWDGLKIAVGKAVDWMTEKIRPLLNLFDKVKSGISTITSSWKNLPGNLGIPGFADGGTVPGPVGAPKLAVVHGGEYVVPVGGNRSEAPASQGAVFNFTFNGDVNDKAALQNEIMGMINRRSALTAIGA